MNPRNVVESRVRRFYEELWNQWRFELADEHLSPDPEFRGSLRTAARDHWTAATGSSTFELAQPADNAGSENGA
jgi:hypothetical protein